MQINSDRDFKLKKILTGQTLAFRGNPFIEPPETCVSHESRGAVVVLDGRILETGSADAMLAKHPDAQISRYGDALIMAGFVDAHAHYAQTAIIASWGSRLKEWLERYAFPEEMKFKDPDYADAIADRYLKLLLNHGTTTACSYCTVHSESADALFRKAESMNLRLIAGKTCMDRNAPESLLDSANESYDRSKSLLDRWHGKGRLRYAITPRFAPTSTPEQMEILGALWSEHPDCLMQTHLSEQTEEVAWVHELFPGARDYLDVYESFGLLGPNAVYGHAIHLRAREVSRIKEVGAALAHCPTSNTFIGSGLFDLEGLARDRIRIGLATDTGGGSSFSMLRTMAAAYEIGQLKGVAAHPSQLLWLATKGSADALGVPDCIGNLEPGLEADLVVLDLRSTEAIAQRAGQAEDFWEMLFPTIMMGDDRAVRSVWVCGEEALNKG